MRVRRNSPCWGTEDEKEWLQSAAERHGEGFDGVAVLRGWLATCDKRRWPLAFNLEAVRATAQQLLESLGATRAV